MEKVDWKVEGMTCTNCALSIDRYLHKEGQKDVKVNFIGGEVSFEMDGYKTKEELTKGIANLGYKVIDEKTVAPVQKSTFKIQNFFSNHLQRFLFCLPFTLVLMLHMLPGIRHF